MSKWDPNEEDLFESLIRRDDLSWDDIRGIMREAGWEDRGPRAYVSKSYRLSITDPEIASEEDVEAHAIHKYLKDSPRTLAQLCNKFEKPPKWVRAKLIEMTSNGYNIIESDAGAVIPTQEFPRVELPDVSITDMLGKERYSILSIGDIHSGSVESQPTNMNRVIRYANEKEGVTKVFFHGDAFTGIYGYRGHVADMIPAARPIDRKQAHFAVHRQIDLADSYFPKIEGVTYYVLGGNHDWWTVTSAGIDAVRVLCDRRSDMVYMGYDVAKVPLTDKTYMRMWHPTGGVAYAKSYKVQKAIESEGLEALKEAIRKEESPHVSIITAGHFHIAVWVPSSPIYGGVVGCFEGQTNYLKRKTLTPDIGGVIMRLAFGDDGRIQHIGYDWIPCVQVKDDWKNFPVPEIEELDFDQEELDTIFEARNG